jgi:hypothetical protein
MILKFGDGGMFQVVENLLCEPEALSSNSSPITKRKILKFVKQ